jgi:kynurenine 3-monooxygenase
MSQITIIGAGLAGSLLAIYMAKREMSVNVFESREDPRAGIASAGRSINLALSNRGIAALRDVGMDRYMLSEAVPMKGRMIHGLDGPTNFLPYSGRKGEYINSVSRLGLNVALINEAEKYPNVNFHFNERCVGFDCSSGIPAFESGRRITADSLIAADGAGSAVRSSMLSGGVPRFNFVQSFLEHGYKELHIPPNPGGEFRMEKNVLHIWARRSFMMIALPNFDGSFTCTLFLAHSGENSFENLRNEQDVIKFFEINFPDALDLMPSLTEDFFSNPTGSLGTVKCGPWNVGGRALLLGDSAHALVPFYGQGMNCAFEDCRVLDSLINSGAPDWERVFDEFFRARKENTDAIADMAQENFYEMRDAVADPVFVRKRELETQLEQTFPDYFSKYSLVTFREEVPYASARKKGNAQDKLLMDLCHRVESVRDIDLNEVKHLIDSATEKH